MFKFKKTVFFFTKLIILGAIINFFSSCQEDFTTNPSDTVLFSTDTLTFDTTFTSIGSATSRIMVYNPNNKAIRISSIFLASGKSSAFKINVDGKNNENNQFTDIEIGAKDSLYIFVQVNVDPLDNNLPLLIEDALIFLVNGNIKTITLQAIGQDAIIFRNKLIVNDTTLTAEKPYLVFGYLAVDSAKTLRLDPGVKIYFHNNANLIVYGNLMAEGTFEKPITMRGDRFDKIKFEIPVLYNVVAGQWGGIYLLWNKGKHVLHNVNLNSGYVGIYFSNQDKNQLPELEISNCRIHNFLLYGLVVQNGNVKVLNSEISNSSSFCVYLNGGQHTFIHCTIANYFNNSSVQPILRDKEPAVMIMDLNRIAPMRTTFLNCAIAGSMENEFTLATRFPKLYKGTFFHCYIRRANALDLPQFSNIRWSEKNDTVFKNIYFDYKKGTYFNFEPDSVSPLRGLADYNIAAENCPVDLNGINRLQDGAPDAGAYEWMPAKKDE
jgi:hypothetical protein